MLKIKITSHCRTAFVHDIFYDIYFCFLFYFHSMTRALLNSEMKKILNFIILKISLVKLGQLPSCFKASPHLHCFASKNKCYTLVNVHRKRDKSEIEEIKSLSRRGMINGASFWRRCSDSVLEMIGITFFVVFILTRGCIK